MEYRVIQRSDVDYLQDAINELAAEGWALMGPVQVTSDYGMRTFVATLERPQ